MARASKQTNIVWPDQRLTQKIIYTGIWIAFIYMLVLTIFELVELLRPSYGPCLHYRARALRSSKPSGARAAGSALVATTSATAPCEHSSRRCKTCDKRNNNHIL